MNVFQYGVKPYFDTLRACRSGGANHGMTTILEHTLCFGNGTNRPSDRNGYGMYSNMVSEVSTRRERTTTVGCPQTTLCYKFLKSMC
jgi:hypothetical protein